jgi:hypothetical protein
MGGYGQDPGWGHGNEPDNGDVAPVRDDPNWTPKKPEPSAGWGKKEEPDLENRSPEDA